MDKALYDPYGDPSHGDDLIDTDHFRYLFQNGRGKLVSPSQKTSSIMTMTSTNCSAFGIAETNLNWNFRHQNEYRDILQRHWPNSRPVFASCPTDPSVATQPDSLPGGTSQVLKGAYGGRIVSHGADHMGRWSYQRLALKGNKHLLLLTAYRPCIQAIEQGFTTVTAQQHRFMSARGVDDYLPRHQFLIDLLDFITDHQSHGDEVLLGIDSNPSVGTDKQLEAFLAAANLVDLYELRHGSPAPSTHDGGRTLDFIYGTTLLQQSLRSSGICRESDALVSDHRAIFADFDPDILFDNKNDDPTRAGRRNLKLQNKQAVLDYRTLFQDKCIEKDIITRGLPPRSSWWSLPFIGFANFHPLKLGLLAMHPSYIHACIVAPGDLGRYNLVESIEVQSFGHNDLLSIQ
jgi:hypothetical protein